MFLELYFLSRNAIITMHMFYICMTVPSILHIHDRGRIYNGSKAMMHLLSHTQKTNQKTYINISIDIFDIVGPTCITRLRKQIIIRHSILFTPIVLKDRRYHINKHLLLNFLVNAIADQILLGMQLTTNCAASIYIWFTHLFFSKVQDTAQ